MVWKTLQIAKYSTLVNKHKRAGMNTMCGKNEPRGMDCGRGTGVTFLPWHSTDEARLSLWVMTPRRSYIYLQTEARTRIVQLENKRRFPACEEPCSPQTHTLPPKGTAAHRHVHLGSRNTESESWLFSLSPVLVEDAECSQGGRGPPTRENEQGGGKM